MSQRDEWGRIPLHYAARDGDLDAIERLLATEDVNARDIHDWTPLHFAAQDAHPEAVQRLLDAGADVAALTDKGMPALYWAIMAKGGDPVGTVRVLRAYGADPAAETIKGYFGNRSPLDIVREIANDTVMRAEFADLL